MPFHDNSLLFLTTLLVIQIYDLEYDSRCERHTGFAFKCLRRHMLLEICSKCEILLKCCQSAKKCLRGLKMQNSATNSKKCSKGAQRNRERSISELYAPFFLHFLYWFLVVLEATWSSGWVQLPQRHLSGVVPR